MAKRVVFRTYIKPMNDGRFKLRKAIPIDLHKASALCAADTEEDPIMAYESTIKAFRPWMRGCSPEGK